MSPSEHPYAFIALYLAIAFAFPVILLLVAYVWTRTFQPPRPNRVKNSTYECGLDGSGARPIQFKAHYYLYAILFLVFDVEVLFLLPFSTVVTSLPVGPIIAMLVFVLLLVESLVWAWGRGYLEWK